MRPRRRSGAKAVSAHVLTYTERNVNAAFDLAQKLVRAKDPQEALALQSEYLKTQLAVLQEQAKELGAVVQKSLGSAPRLELSAAPFSLNQSATTQSTATNHRGLSMAPAPKKKNVAARAVTATTKSALVKPPSTRAFVAPRAALVTPETAGGRGRERGRADGGDSTELPQRAGEERDRSARGLRQGQDRRG